MLNPIVHGEKRINRTENFHVFLDVFKKGNYALDSRINQNVIYYERAACEKLFLNYMQVTVE